MRSFGSHLAVAALLVSAPAALSAQTPLSQQPGSSLRSLESKLVPESVVGQSTSSEWEDRLLSALGGAALGAGLGFFISHVDHSDWDEIPGRREASRGLWSVLGGGVGFAIGFSFPVSLRRNGTPSIPAASTGRSVIPHEEIEDVSADNAYEVVRLLRPEWLNTRPPRFIGEIEPEGPPVYLDGFRYGPLESMRGIHVQTIELIRFVPAATATARWGVGHPQGVIQIITSG